jgi:uncharacterized protein YgbK (DUF1537 family)
MRSYVRDGKPGAIIVGSHVKKTTEQLNHLLQAPGVVGLEVKVEALRDGDDEARDLLLFNIIKQVNSIHREGQVPVVYTSRQELSFDTVQARLDFGLEVSRLLMDVIRQLPPDIGFLISKGGITSNDTLSTGLSLTSARLLGQILPGVSVVRTPEDHPQFPRLPVVLFPGNVGDATALTTAYQRLAGSGA